MSRSKILLVCARTFRNNAKETHKSFWRSLQVMKHGFAAAFHGLSDRLFPERVNPSLHLEKARQVTPVWSASWLFWCVCQCLSQVFTAGSELYTDILWCLWEGLVWELPEKWCTGAWFLHHSSNTAHPALSVHQFLTSNDKIVVLHSLCYPGGALFDFSDVQNWSWHWRE